MLPKFGKWKSKKKSDFLRGTTQKHFTTDFYGLESHLSKPYGYTNITQIYEKYIEDFNKQPDEPKK